MSNTAPDYVRPNGFIGLKAGRTELLAETRLLRFVRMSQVKSTFSATCRAYGGAERLRAGLSVAERKAAAGSQIAAAELNPRGWSQLDSATGQFYRRVEKLILFPLFVDSSAVAGIRSSNREACGALASSIVPEMRRRTGKPIGRVDEAARQARAVGSVERFLEGGYLTRFTRRLRPPSVGFIRKEPNRARSTVTESPVFQLTRPLSFWRHTWPLSSVINSLP
ncbi:hypothetical protein SAMN05216562_0860 [Microbulbifer marinus]|uniref:Uncharacterized protein n=1 Tax=Microbulbifer marinus TaxID=658218 RepID=A0A1H3WHB6_9GAMM|nr:hypothetical protein SAMN05216562_0860 [Microbulbifer marinus]